MSVKSVVFGIWLGGMLSVGAAEKPNVIYFMADDLGWVDIAASAANIEHGSRDHETPHIDKFVRQGMSFTHAYTQQNCQPTRTALLSGQYAVNPMNNTYNVTSLKRYDKQSKGWPKISIKPYSQQKGGIDTTSTSLFEMLQKAGYQTAWFGKNHGCGTDEQLKKNHGIDVNFACGKKVKGTVKKKPSNSNYLALKDDTKGWIFDGRMRKYAAPYTENYVKKHLLPVANGNRPMRIVGKPKHLTDAIGDAVTDYIEKRASEPGPFIAYVPFHAVHSGIVTRPDLLAKYKAKPSSDQRHRKAKYGAFVEQLDQTVGRILNALENSGQAENTLVVFTSDNGGVRGITKNTPLRSAKGSFYEGGLRVPFVVRWPKEVAAGTVSHRPIHCIDVYPTLAEMAGGSLPDPETQVIDGASLVSILRGNPESFSRDSLFWHFPGYMDERNHPRSLIQKRVGESVYKLFFNYTDGSYEVYNLTEDLSEASNLLDTPDETIKNLAQEMNLELISWLQKTQAPTGTWRVNGNKVAYPAADMESYQLPDQSSLTPIKSK